MSAGALPPDVPSSYVGLAGLSLFMAVSQLSVCMCLMLGLACIVLYCFHGCAAYGCVNVNTTDATTGA
jgi:hypothetical protein